MTEHSDPRKIEAGIERDRAALASALGSLRDRVSVDGLARDVMAMISGNAASCTRSIDAAVRANPLALALTAGGIAWLVLGSRKAAPDQSPVHPQSLHRWEDDGGTATLAGSIDPAAWTVESDALRRRASDTLRRIESDARDALSGKLAQARDFAAERAGVLADLTTGLTRSLRHGLGDLSQSAQERIASARAIAYAAGLRTETQARDSTRQVGRMIEDHPMVTGAIALALGAVLGAILPRGRIDDRTFAPERDRLVAEATRLLSEERTRASQVAGDLAADVTAAARDMLRAVAERVADQAQGVLDRATATATETIPATHEPARDPVHETHRQD